MTLADRIVVLNGGVVQQVGTPLDLYDRPANRFVAQFIGSPTMNILPVVRNAAGARLANGALVPGVLDGTARKSASGPSTWNLRTFRSAIARNRRCGGEPRLGHEHLCPDRRESAR